MSYTYTLSVYFEGIEFKPESLNANVMETLCCLSSLSLVEMDRFVQSVEKLQPQNTCMRVQIHIAIH